MEETTEPIIAVIGHPIAGNPTQFAIETGLESADVDCRVLSIDLSPAKLEAAIVGMKAMNFKAVWVAASCQESLQQLVRASMQSETPHNVHAVDLLEHSVASPGEKSAMADYSGWSVSSLKQEVARELILNAWPDSQFTRAIWVDDHSSEPEFPPESVEQAADQKLAWLTRNRNETTLPITAANIEWNQQFPTFDQIQITQQSLGEGERLLIVVERFDGDLGLRHSDLRLDERVCVIDFREDWDPKHMGEFDRLRTVSDGLVISAADLHANCLSKLVDRLFGKKIPVEIFQEAIDEYLAI